MSDEIGRPLQPENMSMTPWRLPPLEYLLSCSEISLRDLELAALSRANECLKHAKLEWEEAAPQREAAGVARFLIEHRAELLEQAARTLQISPEQQFPGSVTITGPKKGLEILLDAKANKKQANEKSEDVRATKAKSREKQAKKKV
jgi:hypothetical protein